MIRLTRRVAHQLKILLCAALLLVPLIFSGHRHDGDHPTPVGSCALCVATSHSPGLGSVAAPQFSPLLPGLAVIVSRDGTPLRAHRVCRSSRGPPSALASLSA